MKDEQENAQESQYGIQETSDVVRLGCRIGNAVERALADHRITISDTRYFFNVVPTIKPALLGARYIGRELRDLDKDELIELSKVVAEELELETEGIEEIVQECFDLTISIVSLAEKIKALKFPAPLS